MEGYLEESAPEENYSQLYDYYYGISRERLEINKTGLYGLMKIPFMDFNTAERILEYRKNSGYIFSFRELLSIREIDTSVVRLIAPFITINYSAADFSENSAPAENILLRSRFGYDIQERRGFRENKFEGNRLKSYQKAYLGFEKNYTFSFLAEKDPGEISYTDHFNFYFNIKNTGIIKNAVIGDYTAEFGQGLVFGGNALSYNSINALSNFRKYKNNLTPYCGAFENSFLRGIGAEIESSGFTLSCFYSNNTFDAATDSVGNITSIPLTGLHRTETEMLYKNKGRENLLGFSAGYICGYGEVGVLFYESKFDKNLATERQYIHPKSEFRVGSLNYTLNLLDFIFTGETAYDGNKIATLNALGINADKNIQFLISVRDYPAEFFSYHANAFGSSNASNQFGIYAGMKIKTEIGVFNINYDRSSSHSPAGTDIFPDKAAQMLINFSTKKIAGLTCNLRYINTLKEITLQGATGRNRINSFRFQIKDIDIGSLILKETIYYTSYSEWFSGDKESGAAIIQDMFYSVSPSFMFSFHAAWFSTDSFSSVIYAYENDLPGNITIAPLYGRGFKYSLLLNYTPFQECTISLKYSSLNKPSESFLGTGYSTIFNNIDNKISFQADFRIK